MGAPISGGGDVEPPWKDLFTDKEFSVEGEGEDRDLEERISDHVGSILDEQYAEHGIPEANASEGMNSDLQGRVHSETQEGFFRNILSRIRQAVHRLWYTRLGTLRFSRGRSCSKSYEALFNETELPEEAITEAKAAPKTTAGCCASIRQFFLKIFEKMCFSICGKQAESSIDFCGIDPEGPEVTVALALMLRMACKWSAEKEIFYKLGNTAYSPLTALGTAPMASSVEAGVIVSSLYDIMKGEQMLDSLATVRGITKLSTLPYNEKVKCKEAIETLAQADAASDYTLVLDLASRLDVLASQGYEETVIVRQILASLRYTHTTLLAEYLNLWTSDTEHMDQGTPIVNYDLVSNIVEANLPSLEEDYRGNPREYEQKLNDMIRNFFFSYQTK
ncbi:MULTISPECIES: hypothetical protein [Chlamydia]|uniref:Uncharacterized protein n=1 Tax=Chlamydophila parapsittaci TaxID=344886 RepID=A0ABX5VXE7_9CHLA|nr:MULTISPECIES: hypothetical protein [Chlamydia]EPJ32376.1 hypothetical protein CP061683_0172 [Chlamydia psittaci 06-1683]EPP32515.1 hypothetical protein CPC197_0118 [Chlamydia psittaci C1/97]AFS20175.1 hypothetical protein B598_0077 [Chlamydia psittaci GR9]AFS23782.1 hypothetical protein B601_0075 [Chlamydia psittaci WS/RT/E30]QDE37270.1 hypothetical protein FI836_03035 [Chlamydophila parapsittaci]